MMEDVAPRSDICQLVVFKWQRQGEQNYHNKTWEEW